MSLDNSRIVQIVRERSEYKMRFVEWQATYALDELAYAHSEQPPGQGELREYRIDRGSDNMAIGYIEGGKGWGDDSISSYCLAQLSNGLRLEFVQTNIDPRTTTIIRNNGPLGLCVSTEHRSILGTDYDTVWELLLGEAPFGSIVRNIVVTRNNLFISRLNQDKLSLNLAKGSTFRDFTGTIRRFLTLSFLYCPAPPNRDFIVSTRSLSGLSETEALFYFAVSLYFRSMVFDIDRSSSS